MKKKSTTLKCSPKIWAKFNAAEKRLWKSLYRQFKAEARMNPKVSLTFAQREVLSHNNACMAVWASRDHVAEFISGFAKAISKKRK